jgi:hypothetical protein
MQKALLLRNGLLVGAIRHCRLNPIADTRVSILALITFLADNNDGICWLTITRMCEIFDRSRDTIVRSIASLEKDGQIGVSRKDGMASCYWPLIPAALAELSANPSWFVDALSTKPKFRVFGSPQEAIDTATAEHEHQSALLDQSGSPDQSGRLDQSQSGSLDRNRSRISGEPVKDRPTVSLFLSLFLSYKQRTPPQKNRRPLARARLLICSSKNFGPHFPEAARKAEAPLPTCSARLSPASIHGAIASRLRP